MKFALTSLSIALAVSLSGCVSSPDSLQKSATSPLTVEELRIAKAQQAMPKVIDDFSWRAFEQNWPKQNNFYSAKRLVSQLGERLWQFNKQQVQSGQVVDDRPLYWTRLAISAYMKENANQLSNNERKALVEVLEEASRGRTDLVYAKAADKQILLTGFDPFLLDRNISQSNPSGLAALQLDGVVIEVQGENGPITAEINTAMVPVRYQDFEDGEVESLLAPFYATEGVDLIATISMGRSDFDLEHFPGLRRSAKAPDNLNVYTGASKTNPIIPKLSSEPLSALEFVEFSLPFQAMQKAKGRYQVNDNREVTTLSKTFSANSLEDLQGHTAVEGGGGGYLSNEISYRSILLRNKLGSQIPTGHIHTPRISEFDDKTNQDIIKQIQAMLEHALKAI